MTEELAQAPAAWEAARRSRDRRFDGRFFVGVVTTGIYCRPVCPAVTAKTANVRFYATAASAADAGFRPCLRCRPETAPGSPAWLGSSATVRRAMRLIEAGECVDSGTERLAERLGVSSRHLRRLFQRDLGTSPHSIASTHRLQLAKRLIDETTLPMTSVAEAAGYGSVRRFNAAIRACYARSPRELRRGRARGPGELSLRLRLPEDYAATELLGFLAPRAVAGVECVDERGWHRSLRIDGSCGSLSVAPEGEWLRVSLSGLPAAALPAALQRVRSVFDIDAPMPEIDAWLDRDPALFAVRARSCRVPGSVDVYELAVRAILGQQVSVAAATTLAARVVARYGEPLEHAPVPVNRLFPAPATLSRARFNGLGITGSRIAAIRELSRAVAGGDIDVGFDAEPAALKRELMAIRGVGPWTAEYVAMRGLKDPDAFPAADLGLLSAMSALEDRGVPAGELKRRAEQWRPWRAYAALRLWRHIAAGG